MTVLLARRLNKINQVAPQQEVSRTNFPIYYIYSVKSLLESHTFWKNKQIESSFSAKKEFFLFDKLESLESHFLDLCRALLEGDEQEKMHARMQIGWKTLRYNSQIPDSTKILWLVDKFPDDFRPIHQRLLKENLSITHGEYANQVLEWVRKYCKFKFFG